MIAWIAGQIMSAPDGVIIKHQNIGYLVKVGPSLAMRLQPGDETELLIHTHMREDDIELFGFQNATDLKLFTWLLKISGVGPRTALLIADLGIDQVATAVQQAQTSVFTKLPRVGRKMAEKIIIDLRSKLGEVNSLTLAPLNNQQQDLQAALIKMGFAPADVENVVRQLPLADLNEKEALTQAMRQLVSVKN